MMITAVLKKRLLSTVALLGMGAGAVLVFDTSDIARPSLAASPAAVDELYERSYAPLVERVLPAVVNVKVERHAENVAASPNGLPADPDARRFFDRFFGPQAPFGENGPSQDRPRQRGEGSGFVIDAEGHIVTNAHVAGGADRITVILSDGRELIGTLVGADEKTDIAVIKVDAGAALPFVTFEDSDTVRVGDKVLAVGNPFGLGGTVTSGIVSATKREIGAGPYDDFLQIDAPINPGNSGGPLFDLDGQVIGVNSMIFTPSGGNVGIGFTISSNLAKSVVDALIEHGSVRRGWIGVSIQQVDDDLAAALGLDTTRGALVSSVVDGSPGKLAGIESGDVVIGFAGRTIERPGDLSRAAATTAPGSEQQMTVIRDGETVDLKVTLALMDQELKVAAAGDASAPDLVSRLGMTLQPLDPAIRKEGGLPGDLEGVVVGAVEPGGPAASKGIRTGDVIVEAGGEPTVNPAQVVEAITDAQSDGDASILVRLWRNEGAFFTAIPLNVS